MRRFHQAVMLKQTVKGGRNNLTARITEEDIIRGQLVNDKSYRKHVAVKLTDYDGEPKDPFVTIQSL